MNTIQILNAVSRVLEIPVSDIKSRSRKRERVEARMISMSLIRKQCGTEKKKMPLKKIGNIFSSLDHSTVSYGIETYEDLYSTNPEFRNKCIGVKQLLGIL